jgi:hypothetical protein
LHAAEGGLTEEEVPTQDTLVAIDDLLNAAILEMEAWEKEYTVLREYPYNQGDYEYIVRDEKGTYTTLKTSDPEWYLQIDGEIYPLFDPDAKTPEDLEDIDAAELEPAGEGLWVQHDTVITEQMMDEFQRGHPLLRPRLYHLYTYYKADGMGKSVYKFLFADHELEVQA